MNPAEKIRSPYIDNVKGILIYLVVSGHFLLPLLESENLLIHRLVYLIYSFHMPAFVRLSGCLSASI